MKILILPSFFKFSIFLSVTPNTYGHFFIKVFSETTWLRIMKYLTIFVFSLKVLQPLMATVWGMRALLTSFYICSMFRCALLCVHSSFAIILMGKRKLDALLFLSFRCLVIIVWLFLMMPRVCLQFVIVIFPDHTHYFCN